MPPMLDSEEAERISRLVKERAWTPLYQSLIDEYRP